MSNDISTLTHKKVVDLFTERKRELETAFKAGITSEKLLQIFASAVRQNPKLGECTATSLYSSLVQAGQIGLEPDGVHAFLVPYNDKKNGVVNCQFQTSYKGLNELAYRGGHIVLIQSQIVYEGDEFDHQFGTTQYLKHKHKFTGGKPLVVWSHAKSINNADFIDVMSIAQVEKVRKKSKSESWASSAWVTDFDEMAKKTVVRRLSKYLPKTPDLQKAVRIEEANERGYIEHEDAFGKAEKAPAQDKLAAVLQQNAENIEQSYLPSEEKMSELKDFLIKNEIQDARVGHHEGAAQ